MHVFSGLFAVALAVSILMTIYVLNARNRMTGVTLFKFDGQNFIRTETNLLTSDGKSAINTKLEDDSPMYQALIHQKSYSGEAILFGRDYDTYYAPLTDEQGKLTGAIFVGHQQ